MSTGDGAIDRETVMVDSFFLAQVMVLSTKYCVIKKDGETLLRRLTGWWYLGPWSIH